MPDKELAWFKGPALDPFQPQSKYAPELLGYFKEMLQLILRTPIFKTQV